jgi:thiol-disulfide isomerase/thioredoxin
MNRQWLRAVRLTAVLLIFGLAGYYAGEYFRSRSSASGASQQKIVEQLPEFSLADLDGRQREISEWRGRTLVINFWATWCAPCRREMPLLQALQDEGSDRGLQVIGIAVDRLPDVRAYVAETGITYPILVGQQDAMNAAELFGPEFTALPFTLFVAADGQVLGRHLGELNLEQLRQILGFLDQLADGDLSLAEARRLMLDQ